LCERMIYNPLAASSTARTEAQAQDRVRRIWQELYGRQPNAIRPTAPLSAVLESISAFLKNEGQNQEAAKLADLISRTKQLDPDELDSETAMVTLRDIRAALNELHGRHNSGEMSAILRLMDPFALERASRRSVPFLLIEDTELSDPSRKNSGRVDRPAWKSG